MRNVTTEEFVLMIRPKNENLEKGQKLYSQEIVLSAFSQELAFQESQEIINGNDDKEFLYDYFVIRRVVDDKIVGRLNKEKHAEKEDATYNAKLILDNDGKILMISAKHTTLFGKEIKIDFNERLIKAISDRFLRVYKSCTFVFEEEISKENIALLTSVLTKSGEDKITFTFKK